MSLSSQPTPWARAMVFVGFAAGLGLAAAVVPSYLGKELSNHLAVAVLSALVAVFAHSWIVIYLSQTGRAVRQLAAEAGLEARLGEEARRVARLAWPWALLPLVAGLATAYLGELAFNHAVSSTVHHGLGWALAALQLVAVWREKKLLGKNHALVTELAARLPPH